MDSTVNKRFLLKSLIFLRLLTATFLSNLLPGWLWLHNKVVYQR